LWHVLEALALMKATGELPVERLISQEIERFGINSVLIVITSAINERTVAVLRQVKNRGALVMIISLDSASFRRTTQEVTATGSLVPVGFQLYVIKRGEELAKAIDSRIIIHQ